MSDAFTHDQIELAASNYESQEWLFRRLRESFHMRGLTISELATDLELSVSDAQNWIDGEVDLTMSELRHLANAIDARVSYRCAPIDTHYKVTFKAIAGTVDQEPWLEQDKNLWEAVSR